VLCPVEHLFLHVILFYRFYRCSQINDDDGGIESKTLGSVCTSTQNPALTRHRQHTTGSTAVCPLSAGFPLENQAMMKHTVS